MRRYLLVALAASLAATGCSNASSDPSEITNAAQAILARAIENEVKDLPVPMPDSLDVTLKEQHVTKSDVSIPENDGPQDEVERKLVRQEVRVVLRVSPSPAVGSAIRVVPKEGTSISVEVSAAVTMRHDKDEWTPEHDPEVAFKPSAPIDTFDEESVRYGSSDAIANLFKYDGNIGSYNTKQGNLPLAGYATRVGVPGKAEPRLDPPPTLVLRGPTWRTLGDGEKTYGAAWLRPLAPSADAIESALWLVHVLDSEEIHGECERFDLTRMSSKRVSSKLVDSSQSPLYDRAVAEGDTTVTAAGWTKCDRGFLDTNPTGTRGATDIDVQYRMTMARFRPDAGERSRGSDWFIIGLSLSSAEGLAFPMLPAQAQNLYEAG